MNDSTVSPVLTDTKKGTAYLKIVPHGSKVRVQRTQAGRTLNRFWMIWLRQLLLDKTDLKYGFAVEVRGTSLLVSSNSSRQGLEETVRAFAAQIAPIPNPPMTRRDDITSRREMWWWVKQDECDDVDLTECLRELQLPGKAWVDGGRWLVSLKRDAQNPFQIRELGMMVECHVALYLRANQ